MDILAHGLWTGAAYKAVNKKKKKPLNVKLAAFWGIFPDLFAFTISFIWLFWDLIFGELHFSDIPTPKSVEPAPQDTLPMFRLSLYLYNISHSAIIFFIVFGATFIIFRKPTWELGGWLLHIFIDIPTHSYKFYPTPFLWPFSSFKFNGFSWGTPLFMIFNYSAIIIVYLLLRKRKKSIAS